MTEAATKLTKADFQSDQDIRWCPGCGDYSILAQVQNVMPELGVPKEKVVFVSGIGCSSRFPYYMNTYGLHSIHGRAPAVATGVKCMSPDLSVWVVTGDGDGLSIGGNHFIHAIRRNVDLNVLMFNNRIYGLTKGQYSPTSELGKKTKSTPMGSVDYPLHPISLALGAEATFVARTMDVDPKSLRYCVKRAAEHKGIAFVEIYQNCNIFNDGAYDSIVEKSIRSDRVLYLEHGKPMIFGKDMNKGLKLNGFQLEVATIGENGVTEKDIVVHDETNPDPTMAFLLSRLDEATFPVPMGVFRAVRRPAFDEMMNDQVKAATQKSGPGDLDSLLNQGDTWEVH
ncbi:MAG: 2-oxoacid:ferredoxin oxidoreductase subunit beta [Deltaproteobacteria bacterium]|nr:2-oxoacid:ferredoxin oxidoreductase subunit beta [Deltaproteobacteria bacterium]